MDVLSREANLCGLGFLQVDKSVYNVFSELANLHVIFCPSYQICM